MHKILVLGFILTVTSWAACTSDKKEGKSEAKVDSSQVGTDDTLSSCANPYSDNMKPMAQGMRAMYEQMKEIRAQIERGDELQAGQFKMVDFIYAEPTDSSVLTDAFFIRAGQFKRAFNELVQPGEHPKQRFNLVLNACIQCHTENCPGPLKKIKKLKFEEITS